MAEIQLRGLLERAAVGDAEAWGTLLTEHQERLHRMVAFRLGPRLQGRVDASDIIQEAHLEAAAHREDYFRHGELPLFLWLRGVVGNKLLEIHRHHLGTRMRDAARDVRLAYRAAPDATSVALTAQLTGHATGPGAEVKEESIQERGNRRNDRRGLQEQLWNRLWDDPPLPRSRAWSRRVPNPFRSIC